MKSVNLYKFSDLILQERFIKEHLYLRRIHETEDFLRNKESHEEEARLKQRVRSKRELTNYADGVSPLGSRLLSKNKSIVPLRSQIEYVKSKLGHMQEKPTLESNLIFRDAAPKTHRGLAL